MTRVIFIGSRREGTGDFDKVVTNSTTVVIRICTFIYKISCRSDEPSIPRETEDLNRRRVTTDLPTLMSPGDLTRCLKPQCRVLVVRQFGKGGPLVKEETGELELKNLEKFGQWLKQNYFPRFRGSSFTNVES